MLLSARQAATTQKQCRHAIGLPLQGCTLARSPPSNTAACAQQAAGKALLRSKHLHMPLQHMPLAGELFRKYHSTVPFLLGQSALPPPFLRPLMQSMSHLSVCCPAGCLGAVSAGPQAGWAAAGRHVWR